MPTTIKPDKAPVKYIRVETVDPDTRVETAGALWFGVSEVPAASLSAAQLVALRQHPGLKVSDVDDRLADA